MVTAKLLVDAVLDGHGLAEEVPGAKVDAELDTGANKEHGGERRERNRGRFFFLLTWGRRKQWR